MAETSFRLQRADETNAVFIPEIFRSVYGDSFPLNYVYHPELLAKELQQARLSAALAFDAEGQPAGYVSIFHSAPNIRLWEAGNLVVVPTYRSSKVADLLVAAVNTDGFLYTAQDSDGIFREAVCCHYYSQVSGIKSGQADFALALDQLDGPSFKDNQAGSARVSCVINFSEISPPRQPVFLPSIYEKMLDRLFLQLHPRVRSRSVAPLPQDTSSTRSEDYYYESAQTWKVAVWEVGSDWSAFITDLLAEARRRRIISLQITLNMASPFIGAAVAVLRAQAFFFGGLAPRWFDADGLLMQQVFDYETEYDRTKLYSPDSKGIAFLYPLRPGLNPKMSRTRTAKQRRMNDSKNKGGLNHANY